MLFLSAENDLYLTNNIQALYFYSSWMPFHKKMLTMLKTIEAKYKDIEYIAIDVDFFKKLCIRFDVKSIPTIIILHNGKELKRVNGIILTQPLKKIFNDIHNTNRK